MRAVFIRYSEGFYQVMLSWPDVEVLVAKFTSYQKAVELQKQILASE